eukprot:scaffold7641_cov115-Cylindrotheca_fusiformis.AAC.21
MESRRSNTFRAMVGASSAAAWLRQTNPMDDPSLDIANTMGSQRLLTLITMALEVTRNTGGELSDAPNETDDFDGRGHTE